MNETNENTKNLFYSTIRDLNTIGIIFGGSLTLTLAARLIPGIRVPITIFYVMVLFLVGVYCFLGKSHIRPVAFLIQITLLFALLGGTWDWLWIVFSDPTGKHLVIKILIPLVVLVLLVFGYKLLNKKTYQGY